ncbi:transposase [Daejeonia sp. YH14]|uniref:transposase n=1 Tax=Daejeonia sp. YH14 TaxID=3439042 RepID=UPI003F496E72
MDIRNTPIEPDCFYHLYNRGVNGEVLFKTERNYHFFLRKIKENLLSVCDLYAYCLMPNHFHLLVKIKSEDELKSLVKVPHLDKAKEGLHAPKNIFSKQFSKVFNSYSQAYNKENNRHGALIESPFKRKRIDSEEYLRKCVVYIHQNPKGEDFTNDPYSSYRDLLAGNAASLEKGEEVIRWFGDRENFIFCHQKEAEYKF